MMTPKSSTTCTTCTAAGGCTVNNQQSFYAAQGLLQMYTNALIDYAALLMLLSCKILPQPEDNTAVAVATAATTAAPRSLPSLPSTRPALLP